MSLSNPTQSPPARMSWLGNSRYALAIDASGSGFSRWRDLAITRWREDATTNDWGSYLLLRDRETGAVWSATRQPCSRDLRNHHATLSESRAEFVRTDDSVMTTLTVAVSGDADAEVRRIKIVNQGELALDLDITSYAELVLGSAAADASHPAFSKIFMQTEWDAAQQILLATRRQRTRSEPSIWAAHFVTHDAAGGSTDGDDAVEFETDRAKFLGRGRTLRDALAMQPGASLSNTVGYVLDPIFSLRRRVRIAAGASATIAFWTVAAESRTAVLDTCRALREEAVSERALASATERATAEANRLAITTEQVQRFQQLIAPLLVADTRWRASTEVIARAKGGAPVLWASSISGDRPIVLMSIENASDFEQIEDVLAAQRYWQALRFGVDVALLDCAESDATDELQSRLDAAIEAQRACLQADTEATKAEVFTLRSSTLSDEVRDGLHAAARIVLDTRMSIDENMKARDAGAGSEEIAASTEAAIARSHNNVQAVSSDEVHADESLQFVNGYGGFDERNREYSITLTDGECTPLPWINVVANAEFGFFMSAEGGGNTWSQNSQQNPLTPWPNDPISDTPHDVLYLRDEESGNVWSATALPIRIAGASYRCRHGKGYSCFTTDAHAIAIETTHCVPVLDTIRLTRVRLQNQSDTVRKLSLTGYVEWALAANGQVSAPFVVTSCDEQTDALFARNAWRAEFANRVAFFDLAGEQLASTCDRSEFLGSNGSVANPAALVHGRILSGRVGAGVDSCSALQRPFELAPGEQREFLLLLGDAESVDAARDLIGKYRDCDFDAVLTEVNTQWSDVLDTVQVQTPDRAMDLVLNDWLLYQTLACRIWARTAYYQSSGAYGFRDQLQDVMALTVTRPDLTREHLLRAAGRQFVEGDVQHWWLPPGGQGIRTRMTDDRLWLAFVTAHYISVTGDAAVLDESIVFIAGAEVADGADEVFYRPDFSGTEASLYEHCARAIDVSLELGAHKLPLIGTGDWNDGMNRVGESGKGESVWLAWFLLATIDAFAPFAETRKQADRKQRWTETATTVRAALETSGWDGAWYRRGYYDDGTPLGSAQSSECKIDAIAQSWSVLARANDREHTEKAMAAVDRQLIRRDDQIALLFTPPFDRTPLDPGYIKGYPPGIRENGGQYTHGTIWSIFAFAQLGLGDKAGELFSILNPVNHSSTADAARKYKVEPYVACADVYSVAPYVGRGGWTWYTGSAGWLYRAGIEAVLGFRVQGNELLIDPCIPRAWKRYAIDYRHRGAESAASGSAGTHYTISVDNPNGVSSGVVRTEVDGIEHVELDADGSVAIARVPLIDDGGTHSVLVVLG